MRHLGILVFACITFISCKEKQTETATALPETAEVVTPPTNKELPFKIHPISHATMVLQWGDTTIYIDPVGGAEVFAAYPQPDLILVTDIHGDHLNVKTIEGLDTSKAKIMVPQAVADKMPEAFVPQLDVLNNGDSKERFGFSVEAIPMYNLREEALKFHTKGRGNGYVIEKDGTRVYISGDTEDIPEMRALKNIDAAFVCMNLPYTMTEVSAADAVLEFAPKTMYPYHYRGTEGLSDVANFKTIVNKGNPAINVVQLDWYAKK
ncbi:metal-dependent hydrolase [Dokdonia pacifica]|uniref:L-ascorbate metabolism protein UlaG, beta-lactamase superfamily n=1 Tax=Dokdonia pacifica TaxID=1627892 RepID=A0A238Z8S6_9FLAO|nr:MBL fold metallo-hydrolase [Dokdonia pacifica]GGG04927.1 metal-dependent hydrolase [Dokdonia pacifica]SNR79532.1 L-ascorbate metabolism protein UlaG, beta-lactamase superfamily [Dokdonia pacifica]